MMCCRTVQKLNIALNNENICQNEFFFKVYLFSQIIIYAVFIVYYLLYKQS